MVELTDTKPNKDEALLEFEDYCKLVRKTVRADNRKWLNEKGTLIQKLANKGSIEKIFGETKLFADSGVHKQQSSCL